MEVNILETTFDREDFKDRPLAKGEYEYCIFNNCDFSNTNLAGIRFFECSFSGCNLSMATLTKTAFRDAKFKDCKMLGLRFDHCDKLALNIHIDGCVLNYSSFYQVKLKKTIFKNAALHDVDFTECDLSNSTFDNCDLAGAKFENTIIEKADFRSSFNYSIDPEINKIKKARFAHAGIAGLLDKYDIIIE